MTELKPCPFCGGEAIITRHALLPAYDDAAPIAFFGGECKICLVGYPKLWKTKEAAAEAWNRRVGDDLMERMEDDGI
jgi:Lar family restriction alleviation protein